ncbi:TetR/AcrR family transcriptional regulator [Angustibacter luteus]|uniref:TetR/AcrR family transcriptional regulator n=1 Tax=Angustibacter luteus TaxID=658456 RepID=A0ABW1JD61_9ACTN
MPDHVNPRRNYRSPAREQQARHTRTAIIAAAHQLFLSRGFAATTMNSVATESGVAVQTVYKAFPNKAVLAKAVFDNAIAGDDESVPVVERDQLTKVRTEPDPQRKLRLYGAFLARTAPRHVPVQLVIRAAAATHPEAAQLWTQLQDERLAGMAYFAADLDRAGHLRTGITRSEARDVLWTYNAAEQYELLVLERGWSSRRYGSWIAEALIAALL